MLLMISIVKLHVIFYDFLLIINPLSILSNFILFFYCCLSNLPLPITLMLSSNHFLIWIMLIFTFISVFLPSLYQLAIDIFLGFLINFSALSTTIFRSFGHIIKCFSKIKFISIFLLKVWYSNFQLELSNDGTEIDLYKNKITSLLYICWIISRYGR